MGSTPATPSNSVISREARVRLQRGLRPQQARDRAEQPHPTITEAARAGQGPGNRELNNGTIARGPRLEKVYTVLGPWSLER